MPYNCLKPFWNDDLDRLKLISIDMHSLWRSVGSPRNGVINAARLTAKSDFKRAVKQASIDFEVNNADDLKQSLASRDKNSFWKCWNRKYQSSLITPVSVKGQNDPGIIADTFTEYFASQYVNSADDSAAMNDFVSAYEHLNSKVDNSKQLTIDVELIEKCIHKLKTCKAAGHDGIVAEHILNAHPAIVVNIKLLFSMMLSHAYVPNDFGIGVIIPIVKDKRGDISATENYRPITLSPIMSKLFELVLMETHSDFFVSDNLQFGFKKNLGCSNAVFALRQCVQYFNSRSSNVYIASLDASKAFDRINHFKLYAKLIRACLPKYFVNIVINWYSKLIAKVRWNGCYSSTAFTITSGVRQGGILSPVFFNMYVNCLIVRLRKLNLGCQVNSIFIGCIMYADDLLLISASIIDLQRMLDVCSEVGLNLGIKFNAEKSKCIIIGPNKYGTPLPMVINTCKNSMV